ncbi:hypothetical protein GCM10009565_52910 [Amycolatopsis albidoflavus]
MERVPEAGGENGPEVRHPLVGFRLKSARLPQIPEGRPNIPQPFLRHRLRVPSRRAVQLPGHEGDRIHQLVVQRPGSLGGRVLRIGPEQAEERAQQPRGIRAPLRSACRQLCFGTGDRSPPKAALAVKPERQLGRGQLRGQDLACQRPQFPQQRIAPHIAQPRIGSRAGRFGRHRRNVRQEHVFRQVPRRSSQPLDGPGHPLA